jgi:hypothetical protein
VCLRGSSKKALKGEVSQPMTSTALVSIAPNNSTVSFTLLFIPDAPPPPPPLPIPTPPRPCPSIFPTSLISPISNSIPLQYPQPPLTTTLPRLASLRAKLPYNTSHSHCSFPPATPSTSTNLGRYSPPSSTVTHHHLPSPSHQAACLLTHIHHRSQHPHHHSHCSPPMPLHIPNLRQHHYPQPSLTKLLTYLLTHTTAANNIIITITPLTLSALRDQHPLTP